VPIVTALVQETGDFELDGVTFPAAEIHWSSSIPSDEGEGGGSMFPTGTWSTRWTCPAWARSRPR
jgi:2-methylaconitate cis-trans-isomerase PrpF